MKALLRPYEGSVKALEITDACVQKEQDKAARCVCVPAERVKGATKACQRMN